MTVCKTGIISYNKGMKDKVLTLTENGVRFFNIGTLVLKNYNSEKIRNDFAKQWVSEIDNARLKGLEPVYKVIEINKH